MEVTDPHTVEVTPLADSTDNVVLDEVVDKENFGLYTGSTKWFNDKLGYGFITICDGDEKGKDIFVHHSGIKPLNSNYKTLRKGEYIQFNIINGMNGLQAVDVTGIKGGPLMCDYVTTKRAPPPYVRLDNTSYIPAPPPPPRAVEGWQTVGRKARNAIDGVIPVPSAKPSARNPRQVKNVAKYNKTTRKQVGSPN
jgi:CspA family cold shock protein